MMMMMMMMMTMMMMSPPQHDIPGSDGVYLAMETEERSAWGGQVYVEAEMALF
jgi:hypothetical protein